MNFKRPVLWSVILLLLAFSPAYSGIDQFFDSSGKMLRGGTAMPVAHGAAKPSGYALPEGIELVQGAGYEFYPVAGRTFAEIVKATNDNGPFTKDRSGRRPYNNEWQLGLSYQFRLTTAVDEERSKIHAALEIYDIAFTDNIRITLPALIDDTSLTPVEKDLWGQYLSRLVAQTRDLVSIIRDQERREKVSGSIREITYLIFDYQEGMDIERTVESYLRQETEKLGEEWAGEISRRTADYEKVTAFGLKHEMRRSFFRKGR
ncbi:MAG: DUF922 domain-containing protein [Nitrospirae bacterium]|nr:MAG: DUF922 domain-containing protein [Nitrospirota bacterium]